MSGGPVRRDESVSFSLRELMHLEDERVASEHAEARAREARAKAEAEQAELRAKADQQARERAAAAERERRAAEERAATARIEAMQRATVEQARMEVEARTRADEAERERRHELELARLRAEPPKRPIGLALGAAALGAALALGASLFVGFVVIKPELDRRQARALEDAARDHETRGVALQRQLDEREQALGLVRGELERTRAELAAARKPVVVQGPHPTPPPKPPVGHGPSHPRQSGAFEPTCEKGDPLCGLDRH